MGGDVYGDAKGTSSFQRFSGKKAAAFTPRPEEADAADERELGGYQR